ncbi:transcriptional regulator, TetR family [Micromonospora matsumotoense]|uniref:Transcriptional regulator, TetR family n=1 Tax=Micromonospora matsumotoense TaxID=121616 RepID=A0A1C5AN50_9ACTN|nr:TetR/AcrR family transcriptional regulator C-terminal domain-containing protein [Micromonospora matsumotoense]SCF46658.1 transcriptional regulator, TetR family [Micromonospora matsumotoense]
MATIGPDETPARPADRRGGGAGAVWLREDPERTRRAAPLTRERIVEAAVALLDAHGIGGLTMRRLAERLVVTPTALYWHVKTKDDVLDLALDQIFGEVPLPTSRGEWRDDIRMLTSAWRTEMLRHPWAANLIGRPMLGPNVLSCTEFLQSTLVRGGLTGVRLAVVTRLLANFVIGAALTDATWRQIDDPGARAGARRHITSNPARYPTLAASGHLDESQWVDEDLFVRGIDVILTTPASDRT